MASLPRRNRKANAKGKRANRPPARTPEEQTERRRQLAVRVQVLRDWWGDSLDFVYHVGRVAADLGDAVEREPDGPLTGSGLDSSMTDEVTNAAERLIAAMENVYPLLRLRRESFADPLEGLV